MTGSSQSQPQSLTSQDGTEMSHLEQEIEGLMGQRRRELERRQRWANAFRTRVNEDRERMRREIEMEEEKIEINRRDFERHMVPLLHVALSSFDTHEEADNTGTADDVKPETDLLLTKPNLDECAIATGVSGLILDCEALISCYDTLDVGPQYSPRVPEMRLSFEREKEEMLRALQAVQRIAGVELASKLSGGFDRVDKDKVLAGEEQRLANELISKVNDARGQGRVQDHSNGSGWGVLAAGLVRAVGEMQRLLE